MKLVFGRREEEKPHMHRKNMQTSTLHAPLFFRAPSSDSNQGPAVRHRAAPQKNNNFIIFSILPWNRHLSSYVNKNLCHKFLNKGGSFLYYFNFKGIYGIKFLSSWRVVFMSEKIFFKYEKNFCLFKDNIECFLFSNLNTSRKTVPPSLINFSDDLAERFLYEKIQF